MIKYICNNKECQKEIDTRYFFSELTVREITPLLIQKKGFRDQPQQQLGEKKYHFCQECIVKLLKEGNS